MGDRVYLLRLPGLPYVKIGFSTNVLNRVRTLSENLPVQLELIDEMRGDYHTERRLHRMCKRYQVRGEWFFDCEFVHSQWNLVKSGYKEHMLSGTPY